MADREHSSCPGAHPAPGGPPPLPDGHAVPQPPLATREVIAGWICVAVVLVLLVAGILGVL